MILVTERFYKDVPKESRAFVFKKLSMFEKQLMEAANQIRELPRGFWIRKIKNTTIFKFRLNNSDRILFTFVNARMPDYTHQQTVLLLDYCTHDEQVVRGNAVDSDASLLHAKPFEIDFQQKQDDEPCETEKRACEYYSAMPLMTPNDLITFIVEERYIEQLLQEDNDDYLYYLSDAQAECLLKAEGASLVSGAAGSGKTTIAVCRLFWCAEHQLNALYITKTELLRATAQNLYWKFYAAEGTAPTFFTLSQLYKEILKADEKKMECLADFSGWFKQNRMRYGNLRDVDPLDIYTEFDGLFMGFGGFEGKRLLEMEQKGLFTPLTLKEYTELPNDYSLFDLKEKKIIYQACLDYNKWLQNNKKCSQNHLAFAIIKKLHDRSLPLYDYVVVDEVQDLNELEFFMLMKLAKSPDHLLFCGDANQNLSPSFFQYGRLKNLHFGLNISFEQFVLTKNYRSAAEVTSFLNIIIAARKELIGSNGYDEPELSIRQGGMVKFLAYSTATLKELLEEVCDKHYCAVVVPDEAERGQLTAICARALGRIFTVEEIKGLEYKNIYCVNLLSRHTDDWKRIVGGEGKQNSRYRYYFNQFYVAVSRAQTNIFLCEENEQHPLFPRIKPLVAGDAENLHFYATDQKSTLQDWEIEINRLQKTGKVEKVAQLERSTDYLYKLGMHYLEGEPTAQRPVQAWKCFSEAASQGDAEAAFALGNCYRDGVGHKRDLKKALFWYQKSIALGSTSATEKITELERQYQQEQQEQQEAQKQKEQQKQQKQKEQQGQPQLTYVPSANLPSLKKISELYDSGVLLKNRGNISGAVQIGEKILNMVEMEKRLSVGDSQQGKMMALQLLGNCYKKNQPKQALKIFQSLKEFLASIEAPRFAHCENLLNMGQTYRVLNQGDKAIQCYQEAIGRYNHQPIDNVSELDQWCSLHNSVGNIFLSRSCFEEALVYYERALEAYQQCRKNFLVKMYQQVLYNAYTCAQELHNVEKSSRFIQAYNASRKI